MPDQFRTTNALTAAAYAWSNHVAVLIQAMRTLREIHGPRDDGDLRCKKCRDSRGRGRAARLSRWQRRSA
jgi:hypothetical protein